MSENYLKNATFAEEHKKATSLGNNLCPTGKRKELYDIGYLLAFNKIDFEEYERLRKEIEKKYD